MQLKYPVGVAALALLAAGTAAGPTTAIAAHDKRPDNVVASNTTSQTQLAAKRVWTPERMAAAKPMNVDVAQLKSRIGTTMAAPEPLGAPRAVRPARGSLAAGINQRTTSLAEGWQARRIPRPYHTVTSRTNAKVFFKRSGGYYVCSGTLVNSATKNMVSTAGHCVSNGNGTWSNNVLVVPAYSSKCDTCRNAPLGVWHASNLTTKSEWHYEANVLQDIGYITLHTNNAGKNAVSLLGGRGTRWNVSRFQTFNAMGYPHASPFNGNSQFKSVSRRIRDDDPSGGYWPGPNTIAIWSNMTGGSSGGAWMANGYQNGLNSYRYISGPKADKRQIYGPYFGGAAHRLFRYTADL